MIITLWNLPISSSIPPPLRSMPVKKRPRNTFQPRNNLHYCPTCNKSYLHHRTMIRHFKNECSQPRYWNCPYCDRTVLQKSNMMRHIKRCHPDQSLKMDRIQR